MKHLDALRQHAYENITNDIITYDDFKKIVCKWWLRKYNIPDTDNRYLDKYPEDIIVEYFEDQFRDDPELLQAFKEGYTNVEDMEKDKIKEIMGDDFTDSIVYFESPINEEADVDNTGLDEETILEFD